MVDALSFRPGNLYVPHAMPAHTDIVVDQFTRQATPFANSAAMRDEDALRRLVEFSGAGAADTMLDVACGPGLVVAAFAAKCQSAAGIDITPAMIGKARDRLLLSYPIAILAADL